MIGPTEVGGPLASRPAAIVTGLESIAGLQSARILSRRGVPVVGVCSDPRSAFRRTRACAQVHVAPPGTLIDVLRTLGPTLPQRAVIVPSTDPEVVELSGAREELREWYDIALPPADVVETLMDKVRFLEFALAHDLPVPRTVFMRDRGQARDAAAELRYPVAIKPPIRDARWTGETKEKAFKIRDAEHFMDVYDRVSPWADRLIAQEWIEGGEDQLYSCNGYFDRHSRPLVTFVSRKLRQWPPQTGMSALAEECRNDEVRDTAVRLFTSAGFHGLAYLEMKRDSRDGRHYIVEPNVGRATGRSAIAEAGGVDILLTMYCDLLDMPLPDSREQRYTGAKWVYLRWDLQAALRNVRDGELTVGAWLRSLRGPRTYAAFDVADPAPFLLDFLHTFERLLGRDEPPPRDAPSPNGVPVRRVHDSRADRRS